MVCSSLDAGFDLVRTIPPLKLNLSASGLMLVALSVCWRVSVSTASARIVPPTTSRQCSATWRRLQR